MFSYWINSLILINLSYISLRDINKILKESSTKYKESFIAIYSSKSKVSLLRAKFSFLFSKFIKCCVFMIYI